MGEEATAVQTEDSLGCPKSPYLISPKAAACVKVPDIITVGILHQVQPGLNRLTPGAAGAEPTPPGAEVRTRVLKSHPKF